MPPTDDKAAIAALQEKHSIKDLVRSGIVLRDEQEGLILSPRFLDVVPRIVPLRALPGCNPIDLLTNRGTISGQLPLYAAVHDHLVEKGINRTRLLFVTFSIQDLISLRAVGMPAALACGLEEITRKSLREFCGTMWLAGRRHPAHSGPWPATSPKSSSKPMEEEVVDSPQAQKSCNASPAMPDSHHQPMDPPRLILVGWTPSQRSARRPEDLDRVIRNVETIGRSLGVDLDDIFVWRPTMEEIRRINVCLTTAVRKDVARAILRSLDAIAAPLNPLPNEKESASDFPEARARFREVLLQPGGGTERRRRRLQEFQQAVEKTFVQPVLDRATTQSDPDERSRLAGLQ